MKTAPDIRNRVERFGRGFTIVDLIAAITIVLILTSVALPIARIQAQRTREVELRRALRELRQAIERYKDFADRSMIPSKPDSFGYPPDFETLVKEIGRASCRVS